MVWPMDNKRPIYLQLMEKIEQDIIRRMYKPGEKLPSVRELAVLASVNPNTMQKALSELEQTKLVYSIRTSGRFITDDEELIDSYRQKLAQTKVLEFLNQMKQLGVSPHDISLLIESNTKEDLQ